jgi:hypothetical protein
MSTVQPIHERQDTYLGPNAERNELFLTIADLMNRFGGLAIIETMNLINDIEAESVLV